MDDLLISTQELTENPTARVPICLVLDTSGSMTGAPIEELNNGVKYFMEAIRKDDIASAAAEMALVTFGSTVQKVLDFGSIHRQAVPTLTAGGRTPMGAAVNLALDMLEARKQLYSASGVDYYQPWIVLMTDGMPTDDVEQAAARACQLINNRKLTIFPIGIGPDADMEFLKKFSPKRPPLRLKGLNFVAFFEWLSKSVSSTSQSMPGEKVTLESPASWASWETL